MRAIRNWILMASAFTCALTEASAGAPAAARATLCLNGDWERTGGADPDAPPEGDWKTIRVPEAADEAAEGSAWFRLEIGIPREFAGTDKRILLRFIRVRHYARIFLNGKMCGENFGARAPFEIDVTDAARPGERNRLEVWVHNASGPYAMKGRVFGEGDIETLKRLSTTEMYQKAATIAEDVFLVSRPALHVSDLLAMPSVREGKLAVRIALRNDSGTSRTVKLRNRAFLEGEEALTLPEQEIGLGAGESKTVVVSSPWADPQLWGFGEYGSPVLYHLETTLSDEKGEAIDRTVNRFGFREVWAEQDKIMLNGKPLRLLAYWQPEGSGRSLWTLRMASTLASGCNMIHNHAEQREPSFYDVADEMGLLVWDANFCGGPLGTSQNMITDKVFPEVQAELIRQYPDWAKAVGNHPSVAVMMIGCLIHQDSNAALAKTYRAHDPTRLLNGNGSGAGTVFDVGAYSSHFTMMDPDALSDIKKSYEGWGKNQGKRPDGALVPLVNSELWYETGRRNPDTGNWEQAPEAAVARATTEGFDWLIEKRLAGWNVYSQKAYRQFGEEDWPKSSPWPSRSGPGQHSESGKTGGLSWTGMDFVNYWDASKPAWRATTVFEPHKSGAKRYLGYEMPVARTRRPTVLIRVTRGGAPAPNACVYATPVKGAPSETLGMRADAAGSAWFELRDPGVWRFSAKEGDVWKQVDVEAPLQPLDVEKGGVGPVIEARLELGGQP